MTSTIQGSLMATYSVEPERRTLHGHFSRDLPPVLTIDSGDTVCFRTLEAGWGLEPQSAIGSTRRMFEPRSELDDGHALSGPIAIRGALPRMTLEIQIDEIRTGTWGSTPTGWSSRWNRQFGIGDDQQHLLIWTLNPDTMRGWDQHGREIGLRPFMGVMGMPPDEPGVHATWPPRECGGNIDCKELVAGASLFLPIHVPNALFSVGDGHATQGDGEVCGTAIECPMDRVKLTFRLHENLSLSTPRARTKNGWLTFGFHEDLDEASNIAINAMLDLMGERYATGRQDALAMASLIVDLRITQIVNGVRGVHAFLPEGAIQHHSVE